MRGRDIEVVVAAAPPSVVDAVVAEEDTYLVLSADPEVREPEVARLRAFHEAYNAEPAEPGSVVAREGSPLRLLAVVHDLSLDPSWREEWVAAALEAVLREADARSVRSLVIPPLGRVHGSLPRERLLVLLRAALRACAPRHLERLCLVVPDEEVAAFKDLLGSGLWR
jgi:hypothetical protein